jgi:hypothetical protein
MNVSHTHRFVYLAIPRTGSRVCFRALQNYGLQGGDAGGRMTHRMEIPAGCEDYRVISTVRNPFIRWVSCWTWVKMWPLRAGTHYSNLAEWLIANPQDFPGFVERALRGRIIRPQTAYLDHARAGELHLLRTEQLQEGFNALHDTFDLASADMKCEGPPVVSIRHNPATVSWRSHIDQRSIDMIREHSAEDFRRFGYSPFVSAD